jgi:putative flippase GtrA
VEDTGRHSNPRRPAGAAGGLAVEGAVLHNFVWHQRFTWKEARDPGAGLRREIAIRLLRFHAGNGMVSILGNLALMSALVGGTHLDHYLATGISIATCSLLNFAVSEMVCVSDLCIGFDRFGISLQMERVCKAGVGPPILIQNYRNRGPTRSFGAGEQAPGGSPQGRSLKALGGHRPYSHTGQIKGPARLSGTLLLSPLITRN